MTQALYLASIVAVALRAAADAIDNFAQDAEDLSQDATATSDGGTLTAPELDSSGLPWNAVIHAGTKSRKADGTWTKRKGVGEIQYNGVVADLRESYPLIGVPAPTPASLPSNPDRAPAGLTLPGAPGVGIALPSLGAVVKTPYQELVEWMTTNVGDGKVLTTEWVNAAFAQHGTKLAELATDGETAKMWLQAFKDALAGAQ